MGLTDLVARRAVQTAHVLVVEAPGHAWTRMTLERACAKRGWRMADSAADADVLAVCGVPGPDLTQVIDSLWHQLPGPRSRIAVTTPSRADESLAEAARCLLDPEWQRADATERPTSPPEPPMDHGDMDHGDMDPMDHEGMDHEGMDHKGMEGMDHKGMDDGDMDMAPAGIPLAQGGEDRDGLEMDVLNVRLGPVLPHWPAGLVLDCALQGDVITQASLWVIDGPDPQDADVPAGDPAHWYAALRCDSAARLLALAGSPAGVAARRVRDAIVDTVGSGPGGSGLDPRVMPDLRDLRARLAGSRMLRWSLRDLAPVGASSRDEVEKHRLPDHLRGDCRDRLLGMLDRAAEALTQGRSGDTRPRGIPAAAVTRLITGLDLAAARLVVASLDLEASSLVAPEAAHA